MHSAIENAKKHMSVYTMHDWLNIFKLARSKRVRNKISTPYEILELHYKDFLDLKQLSGSFLKTDLQTQIEIGLID